MQFLRKKAYITTVLLMTLIFIPWWFNACSDPLPSTKKNSSSNNVPPPDDYCDSSLVSKGGCLSGVLMTGGYYTGLTGETRPNDAADLLDENVPGKNLTPFSQPLLLEQVSMGPIEPLNGFPVSPTFVLTDSSSNPINEFFVLRLFSRVSLPDGYNEGNFQFAVISDDAVRLRVGTPDGSTKTASSEEFFRPDRPDVIGHHPIRMTCLQHPLYLTKDRSLPLEIEFTNGVGASALILVMRPFSTNNTLCGEEVRELFGYTPQSSGPDTYDYNAGMNAIWNADGWYLVPQSSLMIDRATAEQHLR